MVYQTVHVFSGGRPVRAAKRGGGPISLDKVIDEVTGDVSRFFFLLRSHDSRLDFDLDLARRDSTHNPVYYVQCAHARVCWALREAEQCGVFSGNADLSLLTQVEETALIGQIADLPDEVELGALRCEPHRLTRYALDLASALHTFCSECCVLSGDKELSRARMALAQAAGIALRNALSLLGVTAPERM